MSELREVFGDWMVDTVTVETYIAPGLYASGFEPPAEIAEVMVTVRDRMVLDSDGDRQLSDVQIMADPDLFDRFPPKTRIRLPEGRTTLVISRAHDRHALGALIVSCGSGSASD